jgi:hypothetical protein
MKQCEKCKYFSPDNDKTGECRVNPPALIEMVIDASGYVPVNASAFPRVRIDTWCGKFESNKG